MSSRNHSAAGRMKKPLIGILLVSGVIIWLSVFSCQYISTDARRVEAVSDKSPAAVAAGRQRAADEYQFENKDLTPDTNIHYTGQYCNECHEKTPVEGGDPYLKYAGDDKQLCRCHVFSSTAYIHPSDIKPTPEKKKRIPADFPLKEGRVACITCHDIYRQCRKRLFNRNSLRGAPYPKRTDFCYRCHAAETHQPLDPHHQINDAGELIIANCLICHAEKPDEKHATFSDVKFIGDIEVMCRRCHHITGNHSGNADHMGIRPSADGMKRIQAMEKKHNLRLPLDENGKMTCITCHNPHEKGVIPEDRPGAKGAGSKYRHRLSENLCQECHQM